MNTKFSIVIPTHNRPKELDRAVRSVIDQTHQNWEMIIVDDGSIPKAEAHLRVESSDSRIHYIWQTSQGPGAARSLGAAKSTGNYILFLDDDDRYCSDHLERINSTIHGLNPKPSIIATGMVEIFKSRRRRNSVYTSGQIIKQYWKRPQSLLPFVFNKSILANYPIITTPSPIEDFEWLCTVLSRFEIVQVKYYTVEYYLHGQNRTKLLASKESLFEREQVISRLFNLPELTRHISKSEYRRMLTHQRLHWTRQCLRARLWKYASFGLLRALTSANLNNSRELIYTCYVAVRSAYHRPT